MPATVTVISVDAHLQQSCGDKTDHQGHILEMAGGSLGNMVHRHNQHSTVRTSDDDVASIDIEHTTKVATEPRSPGVVSEKLASVHWKPGSSGTVDAADAVADKQQMQEAIAARLRLAKLLSFTSGAGMVAWNKFSSLWLLSVGLSPTEVGVLKTSGLLAKSVCQPLWALLADFRTPARIHPALAPVSLHFVAICSGILSLLFMELLHQTAARMAFTGMPLPHKRCKWPGSSGSLPSIPELKYDNQPFRFFLNRPTYVQTPVDMWT